jgi:hypothetical protein
MAEERESPNILEDVGNAIVSVFTPRPRPRNAPKKQNFLEYLVEQAGLWNISRALFLWIIFTGEYAVLSYQIPQLPLFTIEWLAGTAPIWLPIATFIGGWRAWVWYIQALYISGRDGILLEIKIPREIDKSPRAMEIALTNFWISSGEVTYIHRGWRGQVRPFFSLEMASFGGEVHLYVWTWRSYRSAVENALYGQYPEVEVVEVEDYASKFQYDPKRYICFTTDYILHPRSDAFPFKTYVEFELDKDPKEENKVDPLGQVIEYLSGLKPHEQVWVQLCFRQCGETGVLVRTQQAEKWRDLIRKEVETIREEAATLPGEKALAQTGERPQLRFPHPTWRQTQQVQTMERNMGKLPFDVVGRGIYIADVTRGEFGSAQYNMTRWLWRAFGNPSYLNQYRPRRGHNDFDYPWNDLFGIRWARITRRHIDAIRRRSAFHSPWQNPVNVMSAEMLATLWHPPSATIASPGLSRIPATKAEPPSNLPK